MKSSLKLLAFCSLLSTTALSQELSLNMPIIQTKYTADPAPIVYNDTVYLFTSHDEDDGENFHMKDWLLYTSTDMVNWQDRGAVASLKDFKWRLGTASGSPQRQMVYVLPHSWQRHRRAGVRLSLRPF